MKLFLETFYLGLVRRHDEHGLFVKDALNDVLSAALPDEEPDGGVRQHGSVRDGAVLRDDVDVPRDFVKRLRRHLDRDGERQFPEGREVRPEVEDVVVVERRSGRKEHYVAFANTLEKIGSDL